MVKLRVMGTMEEIEKYLKQVEGVLNILSISEPYANKGNSKYFRLYIEIE